MTTKKNKKEIICNLANKYGLTQVQVTKIVHGFFDEIMETLEQCGVLELRNFGVFKVKRCKPRKARNPRNNVEVMVDEKFTVKFKAGREMAERIDRAKVEAPKQKRKTKKKSKKITKPFDTST